MAYNDRPEFADLAAVIQDQLAKIGVKVTIRTGSNASVQPDLLAGKFDAALFSRGYLLDAADPLGYLSWTGAARAPSTSPTTATRRPTP